jgi:hypothetical protein
VDSNEPGDGGCQCGRIRYRLLSEPLALYVCHCTDCQKQSASAFGMSLMIEASNVDFVQGADALQSWDTRGDDGSVKRCYFCPDCGSRLMHGFDDPAQRVSIKAGSLDDTRGLRPAAHIWLKSAQPWFVPDRQNYLCFDGEPDDEAVAEIYRTARNSG